MPGTRGIRIYYSWEGMSRRNFPWSGKLVLEIYFRWGTTVVGRAAQKAVTHPLFVFIWLIYWVGWAIDRTVSLHFKLCLICTILSLGFVEFVPASYTAHNLIIHFTYHSLVEGTLLNLNRIKLHIYMTLHRTVLVYNGRVVRRFS